MAEQDEIAEENQKFDCPDDLKRNDDANASAYNRDGVKIGA